MHHGALVEAANVKVPFEYAAFAGMESWAWVQYVTLSIQGVYTLL